MSLPAGERLGHYEILGELGRGGMGVVYRARDTRLGREVAVKVSSERFGERFEREARVVASLNHPGICTLYDVGPNYLVMELIEGESPKGPLPLDTVLDYARQMADALDYAHEHGVTHRDLKPGNLKVTPEGTLKVLDFGLAKMGPGAKLASSEDSPTLTVGMTEVGVILGTAAYMAPEQAKGKPVDKRADIWSFGVVLYELATGKRLFKGEDISDTLASVLKEEPDFTPVPLRLRPLLKRCLEKDPKKRLRDIADAAILLAEPSAQPAARRASWIWPAVAALSVITAALALWNPWRVEPPLPPVTQFEVELPSGATGSRAVSPNGRMIAISTSNPGRLSVYFLDSGETRELPQVESGAGVPFWSFDSRWLVYPSADRTVKKIDIRGGLPQTICSGVSPMVGGTWNAEGVVLVSAGNAGLLRVTSSGCEPMAGIDVAGFPVFLPDGRRFTYVAPSPEGAQRGFLGDLNGKAASSPLMEGVLVRYVPPAGTGHGHLLWLQDGNLLARPLDEASGQLTGETVVMAENVQPFSASATTLAYSRRSGPASLQLSQLTWVDRRTGKAIGTIGEPAAFESLSLSPKEDRAAVLVRTLSGTSDLHLMDMGVGRMQRLTTNQPVTGSPVWSADGTQIAYTVYGLDGRAVYRRAEGGFGESVEVLKLTEPAAVTSWSPDERYMLRTRLGGSRGTGQDIMLISLDGSEPKETPLIATSFNESGAVFSPDGRWIAYLSDDTERREVYVRSFVPGTEGSDPSVGLPSLVSKGVSSTQSAPGWQPDSLTVMYASGEREEMHVTMTDTERGFFGEPVRIANSGSDPARDVFSWGSGDGQRILAARRLEPRPAPAANQPQKMVVLLNWQSLLAPRSPQ